MSGRLVILPKKTYTPWNPQNVERVMKDERLHKERVEREEEERRKRASMERIRMMKERMRNTSSGTGSSPRRYSDPNEAGKGNEHGDNNGEGSIYDTEDDRGHIHIHAASKTHDTSTSEKASLKHVNLFENEEKLMLQSTILGNSTDGNHNNICDKTKTNHETRSVGIMPVFLTDRPGPSGESGHRRRGGSRKRKSSDDHLHNYHHNDNSMDSPFYKRDDCLEKKVDDKVKLRLDPMSQFVKETQSNSINETDRKFCHKSDQAHKRYNRDSSSSSPCTKDSTRIKSKRKKEKKKLKKDSKKRRKDKSDALKSVSKSKLIDELRARKQLREEAEHQREEDLRRRK